MDCPGPNWLLIIGGGLGLLVAGIFIGLCIAVLVLNSLDPDPRA